MLLHHLYNGTWLGWSFFIFLRVILELKRLSSGIIALLIMAQKFNLLANQRIMLYATFCQGIKWGTHWVLVVNIKPSKVACRMPCLNCQTNCNNVLVIQFRVTQRMLFAALEGNIHLSLNLTFPLVRELKSIMKKILAKIAILVQ